MADAPTGTNNRDNPYYARVNHVKLARQDRNRAEFAGTIGGEAGSSITATITPATAALVVGEALNDTPNWVAITDAATYSSSDPADVGTPTVTVNYLGSTPDATTPFADGDLNRFSITVTYLSGNTRTFMTIERTVRYGVDPTVSISGSSSTVTQGLVAGSTLATITLTNTSEAAELSGDDADLFELVGGSLRNVDDLDTLGSFDVTVNINNSRPGSDSAAFTLTVTEAAAVATVEITEIGPQPSPNADVPVVYSTSADVTVEAVLYFASESRPDATDFDGGGAPTYIDLGTVALTIVGDEIALAFPDELNGSYKLAFLPPGGGDSDVAESPAVTIDTRTGEGTLTLSDNGDGTSTIDQFTPLSITLTDNGDGTSTAGGL